MFVSNRKGTHFVTAALLRCRNKVSLPVIRQPNCSEVTLVELGEACAAMESTPKLERVVSDTERSVPEKKDAVMQKIEQENENLELPDSAKPPGLGLPPSEALKRFFDRIPLFSVPGIGTAEVLELNMTDTISAAIEKLYVQEVLGAPVRDPHKTNHVSLADQYVGLLDFASLVLWALEEFEVAEAEAQISGMVLSPTDAPQNATASVEARNPDRAEEHAAQVQEQLERAAEGQSVQSPESLGTSQREQSSREGFFGLLDKLDNVKSTQVSAMARSFRWGPFLPVRPEDTLLHVLLLLSKHQLKAIPVVDAESSKSARGFITQDVAVQLLLQCEGLPWFETIAANKLSDSGFETDHNAGQMILVHGDDTLMTAFRAMWKYRISGVPVVDRSSKALIGNIRYSDLRIILDKPHVFLRRKEMSVLDFMREGDGGNGKKFQGSSQQGDLGAVKSAAALSLANIQTPEMQEPVTFDSHETMKQAMQALFKARSDRGYIVDSAGRVKGVVTLRDLLIQFSPPLAEQPPMSGFFDNALQQTGAFMGPGSVVTVHQT